MPAPIAAVGSMMVSGIFKGGSLLTGLGSMVSKFKNAQQEGKSTGTEMKRMTGHANLLRNALAMIGVGGFSALLMQTPALAGGLVKIKTEMMLMANIVGRALKPALDDVATILQGIRTGDLSKIKQGISDLTSDLLKLTGKIVTVIIEPVIGGEATETVKTDFKNWLGDLKMILDEEGPSFNFMSKLFITPLKWVWNNRETILSTLKDIMDSVSGKLFPGFREDSPLDKLTKGLYGLDRWVGQSVYDVTGVNIPGGQEIETENRRAPWEKEETTIGVQTNHINIDMRGITGNIEEPSVLNKILAAINVGLRDEQKAVMY